MELANGGNGDLTPPLIDAVPPQMPPCSLTDDHLIYTPNFTTLTDVTRDNSRMRPMRRFRDLVRRRRLPRVALLSPLSPNRPGVAEYAAAIGAALGKVVELHLFTETGDAAPIANVASVRPLHALPPLASRFDRIIGIVANCPSHLRTLQFSLHHHATCIILDSHLLDLYAEGLGEERTLAVAGRELRRPVLRAEVETWLADQRKLEALFLGEVMEAAASVIVHSAVTARSIVARFGRMPIHLPFPVLRAGDSANVQPGARRAARKRLGFEDDTISIVTPGLVRPNKAPLESIEAIEMLRRWGMRATLHFAGGQGDLPGGAEALGAYAAALGVGDAVRCADHFLPEQTYRDYLLAGDLALNLRSYDFGGVSGALLDCAGAGLPTVTNASLREAADIPSELARIVPDHLSPVLIAEALAALAEAGSSPECEAVRRAFCEARGVEAYARLLCEALDFPVPAQEWFEAEPAA